MSASSWSSNAWDTRIAEAHWPSASIVIPAYGNEGRLEAVLEALARQDYVGPWEVLVVDDGTEPPLAPKTPPGLEVTVLRQRRTGFGAGRARHTGALRSEGAVICFLDSDMLPFEGWLSAHVAALAPGWTLGCGFRRHVEHTVVDASVVRAAPSIPDLFVGERFEEPAWLERWWQRTDEGRRSPQHLWRVTSSGSQSVSRDLYFAAGGYATEAFTGWGGEDNEFGYRVLQSGGFVRPVREALAWHLGPATATSAHGESRLAAVRRQLAARIPDPGLAWDEAVAPHVPEVVLRLSLPEGVPAAAIMEGVGALLGGLPRRRLGVVVEHPSSATAAYLNDIYRYEGAVWVGAAPAPWRFARVRIEAGEFVSADDVQRMAEVTREGRAAESVLLGDDGRIRAKARLVRVAAQVERGVAAPGALERARRVLT